MEAERQQDRRLSPLGPREEAGARGPGSATSLVLPPGALAPFLRSAAGSGCGVGVGSELGGSGCGGAVCRSVCGVLTIPSPQCRCGQRHQPVHAPPRGADQERGQEVGEEFLPEKGASLSDPTWTVPPQRARGSLLTLPLVQLLCVGGSEIPAPSALPPPSRR